MLLAFFLPFVNCTVLVPFTAVTLYFEPLTVAFLPTLTVVEPPVLLSSLLSSTGLSVAVGALVGVVSPPGAGAPDSEGAAELSTPVVALGSALGEAEGAAVAEGAGVALVEGT